MYYANIEKEIQKVWFGKVPLWRVFWIYKILMGGLFGLIIQVIFNIATKGISSIFLSLYVIFHVWILKGLFACRRNCKKPELFSPLIIIFISINTVILTSGVIMFLLPEHIRASIAYTKL